MGRVSPDTWGIDFEFDDSTVHCLVAINFATGQCLHFWADDLADMAAAPFCPGDRLVAFYAPAEVGCFLRLGWERTRLMREFDMYQHYSDGIDADFSCYKCVTHKTCQDYPRLMGLSGSGAEDAE